MAREEKNTAIFVAYEEEGEPDCSVPEKNLLLAVLLNAVNDLRKDGACAARALEYFLSPEEDYLFSFRSVCNYLNIDHRRVLRAAGLGEDQPGQPMEVNQFPERIPIFRR